MSVQTGGKAWVITIAGLKRTSGFDHTLQSKINQEKEIFHVLIHAKQI